MSAFARRHAADVAGMVFLDAANSDGLERLAPRQTPAITAAARVVPFAARIGLLRLIDPFDFRREPSAEAAPAIARLYRPEPMATLCGLVRGAQVSVREFRAAPAFPSDMRLTVLAAETNARLLPRAVHVSTITIGARQDLLRQFSRRSSRGTFSIVPGSDHLIATSQPRAVSDAVLAMLAEIRAAR
jgi:pimeloyl-ACP methyl ester carboxylesterase